MQENSTYYSLPTKTKTNIFNVRTRSGKGNISIENRQLSSYRKQLDLRTADYTNKRKTRKSRMKMVFALKSRKINRVKHEKMVANSEQKEEKKCHCTLKLDIAQVYKHKSS